MEQKEVSKRGAKGQQLVFSDRLMIAGLYSVTLCIKTICKQPKEATDREKVGHMAGDLIVSGKNISTAALLTIVDRKSRYAFIEKIKDKPQESVIAAFNRMEHRIGAKRFREIMKTLMLDKGSECLDWESLERSVVNKTMKRMTVYFAIHALAKDVFDGELSGCQA